MKCNIGDSVTINVHENGEYCNSPKLCARGHFFFETTVIGILRLTLRLVYYVSHPLGWKVTESYAKEPGHEDLKEHIGKTAVGVPEGKIVSCRSNTISAPIKFGPSGCFCADCGGNSHMAAPNLTDGRFVCYPCRHDHPWKWSDLLAG